MTMITEHDSVGEVLAVLRAAREDSGDVAVLRDLRSIHREATERGDTDLAADAEALLRDRGVTL